MKKTTLLAVAALAMSFASCKKDYTCTCVSSYPGSTMTTTSIKILKGVSSGAAKASCVDNEIKDSDGTTVSTTDCSLSK